MILTNQVKIIINSHNIKKYIEDGYNCILNNECIINIEHLKPSSNIKIKVRCDIETCLNEKEISYRSYLKNIKNYNIYCCSNKCSTFKVEQTNLLKYGTKYPLQNKIIKNNLEEFFIKKYGFKNPSSNKDIKYKKECTMIDKFGYKTNLIVPDIHKKAIENSLSEESKNKRIKTNIERYGFDNVMKNSEISTKSIKKSLENNFKKYNYQNLSYQGSYELDFLKYCNSKNIIDKITKIDNIRFYYDGKFRFYIPDFYIPELNLIIEIKSKYYYYKKYDLNIRKQQECLNNGYNFMFIIDKNYEYFDIKCNMF